jgi:hypothetical protein
MGEYVCDPSYSGGINRGIIIRGQLQQKLETIYA